MEYEFQLRKEAIRLTREDGNSIQQALWAATENPAKPRAASDSYWGEHSSSSGGKGGNKGQKRNFEEISRQGTTTPKIVSPRLCETISIGTIARTPQKCCHQHSGGGCGMAVVAYWRMPGSIRLNSLRLLGLRADKNTLMGLVWCWKVSSPSSRSRV